MTRDGVWPEGAIGHRWAGRGFFESAAVPLRTVTVR
jgi:hypothetical protein